MDKNAKIYVSGHSGMVGQTMMDLLKDYTNVIVRTSSELDLRDEEVVDKFFAEERPEYVFHFAAKVGGIMANVNDPVGFHQDNLKIGRNVINAAHKYGVKKLLNLGSSCIYPRECDQPMKEEYLGTGPLEPTNEGYAKAKIDTLELCGKYRKQGDDFISLMPCNLYGVNEYFDVENSHVVAALIMKMAGAEDVELWGTGSARREFMYVGDLVRAALYFMEQPSFEEDFINVGTGEDVSIKELAELIGEVVGFEGEISWDSSKPDGMPRKLLDVSRMKAYGFSPSTDLKEGVKLTYAYYKSL